MEPNPYERFDPTRVVAQYPRLVWEGEYDGSAYRIVARSANHRDLLVEHRGADALGETRWSTADVSATMATTIYRMAHASKEADRSSVTGSVIFDGDRQAFYVKFTAVTRSKKLSAEAIANRIRGALQFSHYAEWIRKPKESDITLTDSALIITGPQVLALQLFKYLDACGEAEDFLRQGAGMKASLQEAWDGCDRSERIFWWFNSVGQPLDSAVIDNCYRRASDIRVREGRTRTHDVIYCEVLRQVFPKPPIPARLKRPDSPPYEALPLPPMDEPAPAEAEAPPAEAQVEPVQTESEAPATTSL